MLPVYVIYHTSVDTECHFDTEALDTHFPKLNAKLDFLSTLSCPRVLFIHKPSRPTFPNSPNALKHNEIIIFAAIPERYGVSSRLYGKSLLQSRVSTEQ